MSEAELPQGSCTYMGHDKRRRNKGLGEARCLGTHGQVRIARGGEWRAPLPGWTKGPEFSL